MPEPQDPAVAVPRMRQILAAGQCCRLTVTGTSMVPFLRSGRDRVVLRAPQGPARRGDIVFFQRPGGQYVLHRVHRRLPDGFYRICGDGQTVTEDVSPETLIATVVALERDGRPFSTKNPLWRVLSLLWIAGLPLRRPTLALLHKLWAMRRGRG